MMPPIFTRPHLCPSPGTCPGGSPDPGCGGGTGVQVPSRNWFLPWHKKPWPHCALPEHPVWQTPPKQVRREVGQSRLVLHFSSRHSPPNKPGLLFHHVTPPRSPHVHAEVHPPENDVLKAKIAAEERTVDKNSG